MDDLALKLFSQLVILPERGPVERAKGERWLMAELLLTALHDSKLPPVSYRSEARIRDNAREWIRRGNVGVVTFNDACAYLGVDAGKIRERVTR